MSLKELYNKIPYGHKKEAIKEVASRCDRGERYVRNYWFINDFENVPESHRDLVFRILKEFIIK